MIVDSLITFQFLVDAVRRQRRDTSSAEGSKINLKSLLMPNATNDHLVEFDLILDDDQYGTVATFGEDNKKVHSSNSNRPKRKAIRHSIYHWPGAILPYQIHSSVGELWSLISLLSLFLLHDIIDYNYFILVLFKLIILTFCEHI